MTPTPHRRVADLRPGDDTVAYGRVTATERRGDRIRLSFSSNTVMTFRPEWRLALRQEAA